MRKTTLISALLAPPLVLVSTTVAAAHPGHTSCQGFGEVIAAEARAGILAPELQSLTPGAVDDVVEVVHLGGEFEGETVPAFCMP